MPNIHFNGHCLKNIYIYIYIPKKVIDVYISYTLGPQLRDFNIDFTLSNCFFVSVKLTKNAALDKYNYTSYGVVFGSRIEYSLSDGSVGKSVIIFGVDMSSSVHIDNKGKDILIFGKEPIQGLDDIAYTADALCSINFTQSGKRFVLSLH